jgi:uncharacterized protein
VTVVRPVLVVTAAALGTLLSERIPAWNGQPLRAGDYAGWAYLSAGGDFPLRWRCRDEKEGPAVTVSLPHQRSFDLPADCSVAEDGAVTVTLRSRGPGLSFTGSPAGDEVRGVLRRGGEDAGTFELARASVPLPTIRPETFADAVGVYRSADGEALVLSTWGWGELRALDLSNGEDRTLFAASEGEFISGPSLGLPGPTRSRFRLVRDAGGRIEGLRRTDAEGSSARAYGRVALRQEEIRFPGSVATLRGTLLRQEGDTRLPAIVILGGSDVTLRQHVEPTARIYAALGLAVFAYDLRGHGQSTGERDFTLAQAADDACAAIEALRRRGDIDPDRIGIAGTSRGGWTGPLAASRCDKVAFLVLFVAPAVSPERQLTYCWLNFFRAAGHGEAEVSQAAAYIDSVWRCTESDDDWQAYARARATMAEKGWLGPLGGPESRNSEYYHWLRLNAKYEPIPALERTKCPVLALYGEDDQVVDAAGSASLMRGALERAGNRDATIQVVPGVDHGLSRGDPARPTKPVPVHRVVGYGPEVWSTVRRWLGQRTRR